MMKTNKPRFAQIMKDAMPKYFTKSTRFTRHAFFGALLSIAALALAACANHKIAPTAPPTPEPQAATSNAPPITGPGYQPADAQAVTSGAANAQIPPITGPGYQDANVSRTFQIGNRRGQDPFRKQSNNRLQNADANGGNSNYLLTVPLISLPSRGRSTSLNLYYNSQLWTNNGASASNSNYLVFNHDADWPAPGWSLGFGKIVQVGLHGGMLTDPDGTPHKYAPGEVTNLPNEYFKFTTHTTDGSLIDYQVVSNAEGIRTATVQYPNGTTVTYGAPGQNTIYATQITDANGNVTTIHYVDTKIGSFYFESGPQIQSVNDNMGKVITFAYDPTNRLTAITAPGLGGTLRSVVRLHYNSISLAYSFSSGTLVSGPKAPVTVIDAIYFPATSTGYWFGDPDSFSSYGMVSNVSQRRGMTLAAASLNDQGTVTSGVMSREQSYNYPNASTGPLNDAPKYTKLTEYWAQMDVPPAVTTYAANTTASPRTVDTWYPDGTHVSELMYNHPGQFDDGLLYSQGTYDPSGTLLKQIDTKWSLEDYDSPAVSGVIMTDRLTQSVTTVYDYTFDLYGNHSTNQIVDAKELDYDGKTVLRLTHFDYDTDAGCAGRHIFNLPTSVFVEDGQGQIASHTAYAYDKLPLKNTPGVIGYTDPASNYRGNLTQITRWVQASPSAVGPIVENHTYDITGNLVEVSGPCCEDTNLTYSVATQFAYPDKITVGATDSTAQLTQAFTYDFSTGLPLTAADPNRNITSMSYDRETLRLVRRTLPQQPPGDSPSAWVSFAYNDLGMTVTQAAWTVPTPVCLPPECKPTLQAQSVTQLNGLGLAQQVQSLGAGNVSNAVSQQYDAMGRLWKLSHPYELPERPSLWSMYLYDSLGRIIEIQNPNGSATTANYDNPNRPSPASKTPGQTVTRQDDTGHWRWARTNALGELVEAVEPNPAKSGTGTDATYSYNLLGSLTQVLWGPGQQESDFQYDALGRLTAEYLAEKERTLDANGNYVGAKRRWSDVFAYDNHSNLISHVDARGVKATYNFNNDPLNRLQSVSYDTIDPSSEITPVYPAFYGYMATGDVTRLSSISRQRGINDWWEQQNYSYDPQGRLASKTILFNGQSPLTVAYTYDTLNRLSGEIYPLEYGTPTQAQKKIDYAYGMGGRLAGLTVDGVDYASQFAYNAAGQVNSVAIGPGGAQQTIELYAFDPATNLLSCQQVQRGNSNDKCAELSTDGERQLRALEPCLHVPTEWPTAQCRRR
jgi:hypothetical protein